MKLLSAIATHRRALVSLLVAIAFVPAGAWFAYSQEAGLHVGQLTLVSSVRATRTEFDYTYRIQLMNSGGARRNVAAYVRSTSPRTSILENEVLVGNVAAGATVNPTDTFTLRHDRTYAFDPAALVWTVESEPANTRPVANAGPDQTLAVGATVTLNGSASTDADGNTLTYRWRFTTKPSSSAAALNNVNAVMPRFTLDRAGTYVIELIVNDGQVDSLADTVQVSTSNSAPTANAGADRTVPRGALVTLDGTQSGDPDGDALNFEWVLTQRPTGSAATLANASSSTPSLQIDRPGTYIARLTVRDASLASSPDEVRLSTENSIPVADAGANREGFVGDTITLDGSLSSDANADALSYFWTFTSRPATSIATLSGANTPSASFLADTAGLYVAQLIVNDGFADSIPDTSTITIEVRPQPPADSDGDGLTDIREAQLGTNPSDSDSDDDGLTDGREVDSTNTNPLDADSDNDTLSDGAEVDTHQTNPNAADTDADGYRDDEEISAGSDPRSAQSTPAGTLPPDPVDIAPPVSSAEVTTMLAATEFLYTGSNPIQTGVVPGTIVEQRAGLLRGRVLNAQGSPLSAVTISIKDRPELGQTLTRADGLFDLAINGGGTLFVQYSRAGYLSAQRQIAVLWKEAAVVEDVVLIEPDARVTQVNLGVAAPTQVARGSAVTDSDGPRQATLVFPAGTTAQMVMPNGTTQSISTLSVRATEYTVGANGPQRMPAPLPPTSGYTYAVELSVDEAIAAGAKEVQFSQPVPFYVDNFLEFPVGIPVPLGSYDAVRGLWVPADSGRIVRVLSVSGGLASLDTTGDGVAEDAAALAALSITDSERQQLAGLYSPGQSVWRVLIPHFSPWDLNYPVDAPADAIDPPEEPEHDEPLDNACEQGGNSTIECQNQILGEAVGVVGTRFSLHYTSGRVPGRKTENRIEIPLSGSTALPASLKRIELEIRIAGRYFHQTFAPSTNLRTTFTWDGKDVYGRTLQGRQLVYVRIGYTYGAVYRATGRFASVGQGVAIGGARDEPTFWRAWRPGLTLGVWDARGAGLGGWTLNAHHTYDAVGHMLELGDGRRRSGKALGALLTTIAGGRPACGGGGTQALNDGACAYAMAFAPDGTLYYAQGIIKTVMRVSPSGASSRVAFTGANCTSLTAPCGDGGPALNAPGGQPSGLAIAPDKSLWIADYAINRVRRVDVNGIVTTVAGTGVAGFAGDGGPATQALFNQPYSIAFGPDGSAYVNELGGQRIRRIAPDGIVTTFAGNGTQCTANAPACGDGGPATSASVSGGHIAVGRDGTVYAAGFNRVRRIGTNGIITTVAGGRTCTTTSCGDGGPATAAGFRSFSTVGDIAIGPDDETIYVVDDFRVRRFRVGGTIDTVAGTFRGASPDGTLATAARLDGIQSLAVGNDGSLYVGEAPGNSSANRIRRIEIFDALTRQGEMMLPADDGSEVYFFNALGRHTRTLDATTGALRNQFAYDSDDRLISVTDGNGNVTTIERNPSGVATAIVGPFGQRTTLTTNADGYLERFVSPAGESAQAGYSSEGLLSSFTNPRGHASAYAYDSGGRLTRATDPSGAAKTLARTGGSNDYTVTMTTALGRHTTYRVQQSGTGDSTHTTTDFAGRQMQAVLVKDGTQAITYSDGTRINLVTGSDSRWGILVPRVTSVAVTTPGGRAHTTTSTFATTLTNANDILSLRTISETVSINGRNFVTAYDAATRTLTHTSPSGRRTTSAVDSLGRPAQVQVNGLAPSSYAYDSRGRIATVTQGQGAGSRTTTVGYATDGLSSSVTDAIGRAVAFARDAGGRITSVTQPGGDTAQFAYDANGNITSLTPPGRSAHTFTYTDRNLNSAHTPPAVSGGSTASSSLGNEDRQLIRIDRADGGSAGYSYDAVGRLSSISLASGNLGFGYDAAGRLSTLSKGAGNSLTYSYDGGLLTQSTWSGAITGSVSRVYDNNFRIASQSVNAADPVAFQYNTDGLLTQVGAISFTRNAQNGLITNSTLSALTDATTFDAFGAQATYNARYNGDVLYSATYVRDALARVTSSTETIDGATHVTAYGYDVVGRLNEVRRDGALTASFTYDANGNRLTRTDSSGTISGTTDAQDRLTQYGPVAYAYNRNGERQSRTSGGQTTTYTYDSVGNQTGVTLPNGVAIEYILDATGRRIGKRVNGALTQGFLYEGKLKPVAELNGAGVVVARFVYGTKPNVPDYLVRGGVTFRIVSDQVGSPRLVVDVASGQVAQRLDYDAFGNVTLDTSPGFQPFGFAGGLYDAQTGLVHFGLREYDPETGRWTTKDPIGFGGGDSNLYAYVTSDPVNWIDPSGTEPFKGYPTEQEAARQALLDVWGKSMIEGVEYGGMIFKDDTGYFYIPGKTDKNYGSVDPRQWWCYATPVATYHTHPPAEKMPERLSGYGEWDNKNMERFSGDDGDRGVAEQNGWNSYLGTPNFNFRAYRAERDPGRPPFGVGGGNVGWVTTTIGNLAGGPAITLPP